jgi:hypothetical protein
MTMDETWLYHYDPETKQQSMEWRHSGPAPKNSECKNQLETFSPRLLRFFGIKVASSSLIIIKINNYLSSKGPNYQCGVLLISAGATEGHFEGKMLREGHQGVTPAHRVLATQNKLAYLGFQCLYHPSYSPDLYPSDYRMFPGLKKQLKGHHFSSDTGGHCCRGDLVRWTNF